MRMRNPFKIWLIENDVRTGEAAIACGQPPSEIWRWTRPDYWPSRKIAQKITLLTGGLVTPLDFLPKTILPVAFSREAERLQTLKASRNETTRKKKRGRKRSAK